MFSIGQCLSIMCQVYPKERHNEKKIYHLQISHLYNELISAAAKQVSVEKTSFVATVIAPILVRYLSYHSNRLKMINIYSLTVNYRSPVIMKTFVLGSKYVLCIAGRLNFIFVEMLID